MQVSAAGGLEVAASQLAPHFLEQLELLQQVLLCAGAAREALGRVDALLPALSLCLAQDDVHPPWADRFHTRNRSVKPPNALKLAVNAILPATVPHHLLLLKGRRRRRQGLNFHGASCPKTIAKNDYIGHLFNGL